MNFFPHVCFAIMGGLVGMCINGCCEKPLTVKILYQRILRSSFTGVLVFYALQDQTWLSHNWVVIIVGLSGFVATDILPELKHFVAGKFQDKLIMMGDKK